MFRRERIITQNNITEPDYKFRIYIRTYEYYIVGEYGPESTSYTTIEICSDPDITIIENPIVSNQIEPVTIKLNYNGPGYMGYESLGTQFSKYFTVIADIDYEGMEVTLDELTLDEYDNIMYVKNNDNIENYLSINLNPTKDSVFKYDYILDYFYEKDDSKPTIWITPDPGWGTATSSLLIMTADHPVNSDITIIVEESDDYYFDDFSPIIENYHTLYAGTNEIEISPETYTYVRFKGISPHSDDNYQYCENI